MPGRPRLKRAFKGAVCTNGVRMIITIQAPEVPILELHRGKSNAAKFLWLWHRLVQWEKLG
ncbi:hypothetical protein BSKO_02830 [Bryopsis sp. KO-2023]|nr:hypothetical protein BSKO_02830 [Bryopsis sp. KO-2023]